MSATRHAGRPRSDDAGVPLRIFAAVIGGLMIIGALIALATPVSAGDVYDPVNCGSGFSGTTDDAMLRDARTAIAAAIERQGVDPTQESLASQCSAGITTRRSWGFPIGALGLVVLVSSTITVKRRQTGKPATG